MTPSTPHGRIVARCQDLELGFPGPIQDLVRQMSDGELVNSLYKLDDLARGEPDPDIRRRYYNAAEILHKDRIRRERAQSEQNLLALASEARATGQETCQCGQRHIPGAKYFVSAEDAGRRALLSGPYNTHAEALAKVDSTRKKAEKIDPKAVFYSFGTVALSSNLGPRKGQLD